MPAEVVDSSDEFQPVHEQRSAPSDSGVVGVVVDDCVLLDADVYHAFAAAPGCRDYWLARHLCCHQSRNPRAGPVDPDSQSVFPLAAARLFSICPLVRTICGIFRLGYLVVCLVGKAIGVDGTINQSGDIDPGRDFVLLVLP